MGRERLVAGKRRKGGRVEPVLNSRSRDDGTLGFGLTETDRPGGGAPARRKSKAKSRKGGRASAKKRKGARRARPGPFGGSAG